MAWVILSLISFIAYSCHYFNQAIIIAIIDYVVH